MYRPNPLKQKLRAGEAPADKMFERGYDLAVGASDVIMLREGALNHLKSYRPK